MQMQMVRLDITSTDNGIAAEATCFSRIIVCLKKIHFATPHSMSENNQLSKARNSCIIYALNLIKGIQAIQSDLYTLESGDIQQCVVRGQRRITNRESIIHHFAKFCMK